MTISPARSPSARAAFSADRTGTWSLPDDATAWATSDDWEEAAESVRHRIRALVEGEAPGAVLSDDAIVDHLKKEGVDVARRTVAKYRKTLGIPSSAERRRRKATLAAP